MCLGVHISLRRRTSISPWTSRRSSCLSAAICANLDAAVRPAMNLQLVNHERACSNPRDFTSSWPLHGPDRMVYASGQPLVDAMCLDTNPALLVCAVPHVDVDRSERECDARSSPLADRWLKAAGVAETKDTFFACDWPLSRHRGCSWLQGCGERNHLGAPPIPWPFLLLLTLGIKLLQTDRAGYKLDPHAARSYYSQILCATSLAVANLTPPFHLDGRSQYRPHRLLYRGTYRLFEKRRHC